MVEKQRDRNGAETVVVKKNEARQGLELHEMRYVLVISTVAAFAILAAIWAYYFVFV